jgi:hypothetical protein
MFRAHITDQDGNTTWYEDVRIIPTGVIILLDPDTPDECETLIPFGSGRIREITCPQRGAIALELGQ